MNDVSVLANGVRYHVAIAGEGDPIILLHGFTGSGENWSEIVNALKTAYRVITIDLLGHGKTEAPSEPERYRMEHAAADLDAILEHLGFGQFHLVGYSMGGRLALYTAWKYPMRFKSLTLESASPGLAAAAERAARVASDAVLAESILHGGVREFVERWETLPLFATQQGLSEEIRLRLRQQRLQNNPPGLANSLRGMGTGSQPSLWEHLPTLNLPLLLLAGELDTKFTQIAREMHRLLPESRLKLVPDAGHTIHLEQPGVFTRLLREFLATFLR